MAADIACTPTMDVFLRHSVYVYVYPAFQMYASVYASYKAIKVSFDILIRTQSRAQPLLGQGTRLQACKVTRGNLDTLQLLSNPSSSGIPNRTGGCIGWMDIRNLKHHYWFSFNEI
ncbi:hypothetical protein DFH27DRAFT_601112 [Peziza echinospora]|nr:hypothetical protein DFH27DRAFT_601112 [Peziza echinospora]